MQVINSSSEHDQSDGEILPNGEVSTWIWQWMLVEGDCILNINQIS